MVISALLESARDTKIVLIYSYVKHFSFSRQFFNTPSREKSWCTRTRTRFHEGAKNNSGG